MAKSVSSLRPAILRPVIEKFPATVQARAGELFAMLDADAAKQNEHLQQLMAELPGGDVRRGQLIFNNPKFACISCHSVGYRGGHLGPDLTSVGTIRTERDLLESIVYPSASFVRSYEPMIVFEQGRRRLHRRVAQKTRRTRSFWPPGRRRKSTCGGRTSRRCVRELSLLCPKVWRRPSPSKNWPIWSLFSRTPSGACVRVTDGPYF